MRIIDFSDGFSSSSTPVAGVVAGNAYQAFASDAAFVSYLTSIGSTLAAGNTYFNSTLGLQRTYNGSSWNSALTGSILSFASDAAFVSNKGAPAAAGDCYYNTTDNTIHSFDGTAWHSTAELDLAEILTNKTFGDPVTLTEVATPATPGAGLVKVYAKANGHVYKLGPDGVEQDMSVPGTSLPTASTTMARDSNANTQINNINEAFATTATAAGTTTLTVASAPLQQFTGTTTQNVALPAANTLVTGTQFFIFNRSTGAVTVKDGSGATVQVMAGGTQATFTCAANGTVAGTWDLSYTTTGTLPISMGGTGQTTANAALNALLPSQTGNAGKLLATDGTNSSWATAGGGGGGSLEWLEYTDAPTPDVENSGIPFRIYRFQSGLAQALYASIKVPTTYVAGSPIKLKTEFYSSDSAGTALIQTLSTLIRQGTDPVSFVTNQRTSTNGAVTMNAGTVNIPQGLALDLTDSTGKINSVAVSPGDLILVKLLRATDTGASDLKVPVYGAEVTIQ